MLCCVDLAASDKAHTRYREGDCRNLHPFDGLATLGCSSEGLHATLSSQHDPSSGLTAYLQLRSIDLNLFFSKPNLILARLVAMWEGRKGRMLIPLLYCSLCYLIPRTFAQNNCYHAAGQRSGSAIIPCGPSSTISSCCQLGDLCLRYCSSSSPELTLDSLVTATAHAGILPTTSHTSTVAPIPPTRTQHALGSVGLTLVRR